MMHLPITGIVGGGVPAPLFLDNFTGVNGTLITAHTPDIGGAWNNGSGGTPTIQSNRMQSSVGGASEWRTPSIAANGLLTFVGRAGTSGDSAGASGDSGVGPTFRTTTGGFTGGWLVWCVRSGSIILYKNGGLITTIGTGYNNQTQDREIVVELNGSSIKIYVDGVLKDSRSDATNSAVATHGFRMWTNTPSIDSYKFEA